MRQIKRNNIPVKNIGDEYILIGGLGQGAFGRVDLGRNISDQQLYAIKMIDLSDFDLDDRNDIIKQTKQEVEILKTISSANKCHPNIVCYYDSFRNKSLTQLYIVMEYIKGTDLTDTMILLKQKYSMEQVYLILLIIIRDILSALEYIHSKNIVHGDIKPENIIIREKENISELDYNSSVLIDFGLSCQIRGENSCDKVSGTPDYVDPNLYQTHIMKPSNDIWSLGITIMISLGINVWKDFEFDTSIQYVSEISNSNFTPSLKISNPVLNLVTNSMVNRIPSERPTASELIEMINRSFILK
jgi:serine/threonine protein kinase